MDGLAAEAGRRRSLVVCTASASRRSGRPGAAFRRSGRRCHRRPALRGQRAGGAYGGPGAPGPGPSPSGRPSCAVVNCGFVEAHQNDVALDIYRLFARDAGLHWAGGLAIGGGGMFGGKPLMEHGGKARHVIAAFDQAVAALDAGQDIPESATTGIRQRAMPPWPISPWRTEHAHAAAKNGNLLKIGARPYRRVD